jgi:hypothetical protein
LFDLFFRSSCSTSLLKYLSNMSMILLFFCSSCSTLLFLLF